MAADDGTPTVPEFGINEQFLASDQREWHLTCEHCGEWQFLTFEDNVLVETGEVVCRKCRRTIDRLGSGQWVPKHPGRPVHGYHISKLFSPMTTIRELIEASQKTAAHEIQEFYNSDLGLPHVPEGGQLSMDLIDACREDFVCPETAKDCTMGVDVGTYLHIRISAVGVDGTRRAVFIGRARQFEELDQLMGRFQVRQCVIDALPEQRKALEFCERWARRAVRCFYEDNPESRKEWLTLTPEEHKLTVHRTMACDYMLDSFIQRRNKLPKNARDLDVDGQGKSQYYQQLCAPSRIVEVNAHGQPVARYVHGSKPDHYFHAEVYDEIAARVLLRQPVPALHIVTIGEEKPEEDD